MFLECRKLIQSENTFLLTFQFFILVENAHFALFYYILQGRQHFKMFDDFLIIRFPETLWNQRRHELVFQLNRECDAFGF